MPVATPKISEALRRLPQIHRLAASLPPDIPLVWRTEAAQRTVSAARARIRLKPEEAAQVLAEVFSTSERLARRLARPHLEPVLNATGVVLHTNLGRAPLSEEVLAHIERVARGYSTLEFDLDEGARGSRHSHVDQLLAAVTGAEAGMAVNNNAAAVLLALAELASGHEVIVSRGQLVEIGGAFRIPDVMKASGARLVEVGTTNKTHLRDYEQAITEDTAMLLKVHTSNFRLTGFVESVDTHDLTALGRARKIPVMEDLGSGVLFPLKMGGWSEPSVAEVVAAGIDLVTFSGDKLLGGPQAGLIVGRRDLVARLKKNPLARAVRVDKMTLAGLEATLRLYREGRSDQIPLWRMLAQTPSDLLRHARRVAARIRREMAQQDILGTVTVRSETAPVGGGSLPGVELPTAVVAIALTSLSTAAMEGRLRQGSPPVVARVADDAIILDMRTIDEGQHLALAQAVGRALRPG